MCGAMKARYAIVATNVNVIGGLFQFIVLRTLYFSFNTAASAPARKYHSTGRVENNCITAAAIANIRANPSTSAKYQSKGEEKIEEPLIF